MNRSSSEKVIEALRRIPEELLNQVEEATLDMAESMRKIVRSCFPNAQRVIDRFHVRKLAYDALQQMRIEHRWDRLRALRNSLQNNPNSLNFTTFV